MMRNNKKAEVIGADWLFSALRDFIGFAGITRTEVRSWSQRKRNEAKRYASDTMYAASDNPVKPKRPKWWLKRWR